MQVRLFLSSCNKIKKYIYIFEALKFLLLLLKEKEVIELIIKKLMIKKKVFFFYCIYEYEL